ncbi:MAG: hemolysin family protein, partial [Oscillospiraceae bacterium]
VIAKLFAPLVAVLTASTNGMLRLCGIDPNAEEEAVSEEEIRMMVDVGNQKGVIDPAEREMIQNVFEFNDLTAGEIATHRTDIVRLWMDETPEEWEVAIHGSRHTLYPVCDQRVDHVVGILNVKDYFRLRDQSRENVLREAVKPAYFVPESVCADVLFAHMKNSRNHFAVVLDEYGGMAGIVTMNDLLEQLVGDFDDESTPLNWEPLGESSWRVRGSTPLGEVAEKLRLALPTKDYDTFGGWVLGQYGFIPEDGSVFEIETGSLHIQVTTIKEHRMEEAILSLLPHDD